MAKEILEEQTLQWWQELAREEEKLYREIGVVGLEPDKMTVSTALKNHDKAEIMEVMCNGYKKLDKIKQDDPTIAKEYMERKSIADSRLKD